MKESNELKAKLYWIERIISRIDKSNWDLFNMKYNKEFDFYYEKSIEELQNIYLKLCQNH